PSVPRRLPYTPPFRSAVLALRRVRSRPPPPGGGHVHPVLPNAPHRAVGLGLRAPRTPLPRQAARTRRAPLPAPLRRAHRPDPRPDRKSTRLNSSHVKI